MNVQLIDKREGIFSATLTLIHENGFHGTAMSMIAKKSNVSIGTIYHYFPSKDNLIQEIYYHCKNELYNYIFETIDKNDSYKNHFFIIFQRFTDFYLKNVDMFSFMEQFYSSPYNDHSDVEKSKYLCHDNRIYDFLMEGVSSGQLKDKNVHILSSACFGGLLSFAKKVLYGKVEYKEQHLKEIIDIIWTGVKK